MNFKSFEFLSITFLCIILFNSCASREDLVYFNGSHDGKSIDFKNKILNLQPQDRLSINVSAQEQAAVIPFNLPAVNSVLNQDLSTSTVGGNNGGSTYVVNSKGIIDFPVLGEIKVSGLSIEELKMNLTMEIAKYVKDPIVSVELENFKISVLGEVNRPGTFTIKDQSISLMKALGRANDLTIYGKRKNILVIREEPDGSVSRNYVDITTPNIINSPFYYLKQNDIVYVEPNNAQMQSSKYRNINVYSSITIALATVASFLISFYLQ